VCAARGNGVSCWLALRLWDQLELDAFWQLHRLPSRKGTHWLDVLKTLVCYRLIAPGSEWRLHRQWYGQSAMADVLGTDTPGIGDDTLYRCLDRLLAHKTALCTFLKQRWTDLFGAPIRSSTSIGRPLRIPTQAGH